MSAGTRRHLFLVAGEPSGDVLGGRVMAALRQRLAEQGREIVFSGVGGPHMVAQGLTPLFPMDDLAVMGLAEVVPRLPRLLGRLRQTVRAVQTQCPDAVMTIDAPDFSFRVARRLAGQGIPLIHMVAPTVWAWRPGRARRIAECLDHLLVLLPFEPPWFEREGLPCSFVGHPVVESGAGQGDAERCRMRYGLAADTPVLVVLPGSRLGEIRTLLPIFAATIARLAARRPGLTLLLPTVPRVRDEVAAAVAGWGVPAHVLDGDTAKYDALAAGTAALAASGTVALELALAGLPGVIAYRLNPLTVAVARRLITVRYVNLVNILLDQPLVPELLQENATPDRLEAALWPLLTDDTARAQQRAGLAQVGTLLGCGGAAPSRRAADAVLRVLQTAERGGAR